MIVSAGPEIEHLIFEITYDIICQIFLYIKHSSDIPQLGHYSDIITGHLGNRILIFGGSRGNMRVLSHRSLHLGSLHFAILEGHVWASIEGERVL